MDTDNVDAHTFTVQTVCGSWQPGEVLQIMKSRFCFVPVSHNMLFSPWNRRR